MGRGAITLDNFADFHGEVHGVAIRSNLPLESYVPSGEIAVDLNRIARAANFGHISSLAFRGFNEESSVNAGIDSVSDDGSATATFTASATIAPRIESVLAGDTTEPIARRGTGIVRINFSHDDLNDVNLREAVPWADHVDTAIREGLRSVGNKKLLERPFYRTGFLASLATIGTVSGELLRPPLQGIAIAVAGTEFWYNAMLKTRLGQEAETTLIPFMPLDRLSLIQAYTRTRRFAKVK